MEEGRFYWLKLRRDFFKRHDIRIVESMPNGTEYILFYLKLLCESVDHEGTLRFSESIPYNEDMLATITNTNVDIVRSAVKIFTELEMMEIYDDGTLFMREVDKMIGSAADNDNANRQRRYREKQKQLTVTKCNADVTQPVTNNNESKSKSKSKELDIDIDNIPAKPQKHKYGEYKHVLLTDEEVEKLYSEYGIDFGVECIKFLDEYIEMKGYKAKNHYLCIRKWVADAVKERKEKCRTKKDRLAFIDNIDWSGV